MLKSLLLTILSISSCAAHPLLERQNANACHDYVLVSARGTYEPQGPSVGFQDAVNNTLRSIQNGIEYDVVYPAAEDQQGTDIGAKDVLNFIQQGNQACPQQKYVLLGYSQGATVCLMALKQLASQPAADTIDAIALIGNPYQQKDKCYTLDQNGGPSTRGRDGVLTSQDPTLGDLTVWDDKEKVLNVCYTGDLVCNGISNDTNFENHLQYGFSPPVQSLLSRFLAAKIKPAA
ncbi:hypothetical protein QQS21_004547 [Conoideocrella luteorostrata]|uniref:Cutinase n=1 Tax=Conoideocrella luteorostrata TaxID=1105319 RepID=A0AAJ0FZQ5_9HYPO|nr:hypothetical protein QQS21_004547 [Conoideocrella luteorostrata]